jgi:hypothetical protein
MVLYDLERALGKGKKLAVGSSSVADGDTIDTGLNNVEVIVLTTTNATHIAAATSISGGTVTVGLLNNTGAAVTTAETVYWIAVGE